MVVDDVIVWFNYINKVYYYFRICEEVLVNKWSVWKKNFVGFRNNLY